MSRRHLASVLVPAWLFACAGPARAEALSDADARAALAALAGPSGEPARAALARVTEARDLRFAAPLVELLRAADLGIAAEQAGAASAQALADLTGQPLGGDWAAWVRWYAGRGDLTPPPGFTGWKGALLGRIDPRFAELLRDGQPARIRVEEIVWGGVAYEGIPALDQPRAVPAAEATWLDPEEPVFGVALGGAARAYPLRILDWHELANDELGGVAIALAYCTLCGSGIVYRAEASDGRRYDFGSSGLLYRSNKLMVDRQTRSLWSQLRGRAVIGPAAAGEVALAALPSVIARWRDWRAAHPESDVLSLETGHARRYEPGAAYGDDFASERTMFPVRLERAELPAKTRVFGLRRGDAARAWPLAELARAGVVNDALAGEGVVLVAPRGAITAAGESLRGGPARWDAGAEVRAYARGAERFSGVEGEALRDAAGERWRVAEDALLGPGGRRLDRLPGIHAYWFAWAGAHPATELWRGGP
jgi:hypothetical protein